MYHTRSRKKNINIVDTNRLLASPLSVNIVAAVDQASLTVSELAEIFRVTERRLQYLLQQLLRAGAIVKQQRRGQVLYMAGETELTATCRILHALWGREARRGQSRCIVAL